MKKLLIYLIFFSLPFASLTAQVLKGHVYDEKTKESVINANVYLEGTSYFTITDADGYFELPIKKKISSQLVISHLTYETIMIQDPYTDLPDKLLMQEKENRIAEVIVDGDKPFFSRKQMMRAFKDQFLGTSKAGRSCVIENEDDIYFYYDREKKTLNAFSRNPLIIRNPYLGYILTTSLMVFKVIYEDVSLLNKHVMDMMYMGPSSFVDLVEADPIIAKRRQNTFSGSSTEFFRLLVNNKLKGKGYKLHPWKAEDMFVVEDDPDSDFMKRVSFSSDFLKYLEQEGIADPLKAKKVYIANKGKASALLITSNFFLVDVYGNLYNIRDVSFTGDMAQKRMGDTLPLDYEP